MGSIVSCKELAARSRVRLNRRIQDASALFDGTEETFKYFIDIGRLIHQEAALLYSMLETPMAVGAMPHFHVITRCREEFGWTPKQVEAASNAVCEYLNFAAQQVTKSKLA